MNSERRRKMHILDVEDDEMSKREPAVEFMHEFIRRALILFDVSTVSSPVHDLCTDRQQLGKGREPCMDTVVGFTSLKTSSLAASRDRGTTGDRFSCSRCRSVQQCHRWHEGIRLG